MQSKNQSEAFHDIFILVLSLIKSALHDDNF